MLKKSVKKCINRFCNYLTLNKMLEIKTFVFFDSETTGLPSLENNTTKVTELCFVAVESEHLRQGVYPRVQNKLSFCINPKKYIQQEASSITGLTNSLLEFQPEFTSNTVNIISGFIDMLQKPVCFVAHNGNSFDYPILRAEIANTGQSLSDEILCMDSLAMFKDIQKKQNKEHSVQNPTNPIPIEFLDGFDEMLVSITRDVELHEDCSEMKTRAEEIKRMNETTPKKKQHIKAEEVSVSKKLKENITCVDKCEQRLVTKKLNFGPSLRLQSIYKDITSRTPTNVHRAEGDVNMLLECAVMMGDQFVDWANANATKFCDIPIMKPRKKIAI